MSLEYKEFSDSATMSPVYLDFLSVNSEGKGRLVAMALALYRRYRPDTFEGVIGQDQVTVPLMRALDEGKLTHAYLFSGPRGCGKTSSARILARCVNCAKGPTSHPCGECESCKDLATGGPASCYCKFPVVFSLPVSSAVRCRVLWRKTIGAGTRVRLGFPNARPVVSDERSEEFRRSVKESLTGPVLANRSDGTKPGIGIERKNYT